MVLEKILNFINELLLFRNYLPLDKDGALHINKLESISPKDALCPVVLEKKIFSNFVNVFLPFGNYLPLEKAGAFI